MSENAAHSHTNYVKIWAALLGLLILSVLGPMVGVPWLTLIAAFGIAVVKALMVCAYFMHLNIEKKLIWFILLIVLALMFLLFFALAPDIMNDAGTNWINPATVQPSTPHQSH